MGMPGIRAYRRRCPHCNRWVWVRLELNLFWDELRKVLKLAKNKEKGDYGK